MKDDIYNGRYRTYTSGDTTVILDVDNDTVSVQSVIDIGSNPFAFCHETVAELLAMLLNAGITSTEQLHELLVNAREAKNRFEDCPF